MEPTLGLNVEPRSSGLSMDSPLGFVVYIFTIAVLSGYAGFMLHYIIAICYGLVNVVNNKCETVLLLIFTVLIPTSTLIFITLRECVFCGQLVICHEGKSFT